MDGFPRLRAEIMAMDCWEMIKNKKRKQALPLVVVKVVKDLRDSIFRGNSKRRGFYMYIAFIIGLKHQKE